MSMPPSIPEAEFRNVLSSFGQNGFSTKHFASRLRTKFPETWTSLETAYGSGGSGAGTHCSAFSRVSQVLNYWSRKGEVSKLDYESTPSDWGAPVIRYWTADRDAVGQLFPDEIGTEDKYWEGTAIQVPVNRYERDPTARRKCIAHYGLLCAACGLDFGKIYGERGKGFIHVHHHKRVSISVKRYKVDPVKDLIPVCPNCHAMIHRKNPDLTISQLRSLLKRNR